MTAGSVIVLAFWVIFTVRKHFTPKLAAAEKANTYDLNRDNPEAKRAAQRRRGPLAEKKIGRPAAEAIDKTQYRINVDESTGEIINFPGETEAEQ